MKPFATTLVLTNTLGACARARHPGARRPASGGMRKKAPLSSGRRGAR